MSTGTPAADLTRIDLGASGDIASVSIDSNGVVRVVNTVGTPTEVARIALAKFACPEGLVKDGGNLFKMMEEVSGRPAEHTPGSRGSVAGLNGLGYLVPGALEMSNVDLALEFTDMITTQRGFQANTRAITTSDEMLQELLNIKR